MAGELQLGGSTVATHTGSGASAVVTIDNGVNFPTGHIIQQEYIEYTTFHEFANNTPTTISGFSKSITLIKSNSKVFVYLFLSGAGKKDNDTSLAVKILESATSLDVVLSDFISDTS